MLTQSVILRKSYEQISLWLNQGKVYEKRGLFEKAKWSYIKSRKLARGIGDKHLSNRARIQEGRMYISLGDLVLGIKLLKKLIAEIQTPREKPSLAMALNAVGYGYRVIGNKKLAHRYIDMASELYKRKSDISDKIKLAILHNKAGLLRELSDYDAALKIYLSLVKQIDKDDVFFRARLFNNIGFIFRKQGQYQKARTYYMKAYKLERAVDARQLQARTLNNLGGVFRMEGELTKALKYFTQSIYIRKQLRDRMGLSSSLLNKGIVLKQMGKKKDGKKYLIQSYRIRKQSGSKHLLKEVLTELQNS